MRAGLLMSTLISGKSSGSGFVVACKTGDAVSCWLFRSVSLTLTVYVFPGFSPRMGSEKSVLNSANSIERLSCPSLISRVARAGRSVLRRIMPARGVVPLGSRVKIGSDVTVKDHADGVPSNVMRNVPMNWKVFTFDQRDRTLQLE